MKTVLTVFCLMAMHMQILAQGTPCKNEANIHLVKDQYGLTGTGVITVMMDRGIDYRHPDFIDADGNTRILYIYDLYDDSGANDPDNPYGIGTIFDQQEINQALQNGGTPIVNDIFGHGTATTGIMSGNGSGINDPSIFSGVAPNAEIISIVVTKDFVPPFNGNLGQVGQYDQALLPTAFEFAKDKIAAENKPAVTLLNIGSIGEPTDGSIGFCDLVDDYVNQGNVFVCGVGDDGGKDNHAIKNLVEGQTTEFIIEKGEQANLRFTGWYDEDDRVELSIERPNGQIEGPFNPPANQNGFEDEFLNEINIYHRGADTEFFNASSNIRQLMIDFFGATGTYKVILNTMSVSNDGKIHGMLNPARYNNANAFLNNDNPSGNICSYSSCINTLSPGDYIATNAWTDINNIDRLYTGQGAPGELWLGSSIGPTMDGRMGIDFVAPGEVAHAAYSSDSYYGSFSFNVLQNSNGQYGVQTAVSAAAPLSAGVIALMLEVNPDLSPDQIKSILQSTARQDNFTGATPNNSFGYGKLDALAAIEKVIETTDIKKTLEPQVLLRINPNPFTDEIAIMNESLKNVKKNFIIYSLFGKAIYSAYGQYDNYLSLENLFPGTYILKVETDEANYLSKIIKM